MKNDEQNEKILNQNQFVKKVESSLEKSMKNQK